MNGDDSRTDADQARRQSPIDEGYPEAAITPRPVDRWEEYDTGLFIVREANGDEVCRVEFLDAEDNADVTFSGVRPMTVCIGDDEG
jgi:hypothetical protein